MASGSNFQKSENLQHFKELEAIVNVLVMRRELTSEELAALRRLYPGEDICALTVRPDSAEEHLQLCRKHKADLVFLPHEQPVPVPAMLAGFKHLLFNGETLQELVSVTPKFRDHQPES